MSDRNIGHVISVDNFRVFIQLDDNLKSTFKSGYNDIYNIAKVNSYIIIPVGADRIVAIITRIKMQEEQDFDKDQRTISLPVSVRYITATMLGTIENNKSSQRFIQGVYNFPVLYNPVWYVTTEDLNLIFDYKEQSKIDFAKSFYLPIGISPVFPDYQIKLCPDQLFVKHAAILGNTGSGKSCTLASILHSLFSYNYSKGEVNNSSQAFLQNAHIIIFDTNGEYKNAFVGSNNIFKRINTFYIDNVGLRVPYWFMNWDDFDYLFEPGSGVQAPILKRAIGLSKNTVNSEKQKILSTFLISTLRNLCESTIDDIKKRAGKSEYGNWKWIDKNEFIQLGTVLYQYEDTTIKNIGQKIFTLGQQATYCDINSQNILIQEIKSLFENYTNQLRNKQITSDKNIDLPTWFNYQQLISKFIDAAIEEHEGSTSRMNEYLSTLRLRLEGFLNDLRIADPLMLNYENEFNNSLSLFLSFVIGDFFQYFANSLTNNFSCYYNNFIEKNTENYDPLKTSQLSIIDMSLVPFDVLENITGLIGRLILEFVSHFKPENRGKYPIVIVLEEAQNYIPEFNRKDRESIAKKVFERIAREGRKYGLSLIVSSQRPSELSKTVLSQCNSFIVHRLQNPDDQKYIRGLVSSANNDILDQLPILPQQHAIIMGDCVRTPVQVKISDVSPKPNSDNPKFIEQWLKEPNSNIPNYHEICEKWQKGERY